MTTEPSTKQIRLTASEIESTLMAIMLKKGFKETAARTCAEVFVENTRDGVYSHGVNRFVKFMNSVHDGVINPDARAKKCGGSAAVEQWDGGLGPGPVNALICTTRAMELATLHGLGCVALANTNHWLRGGTYGWKAAKTGYVFIGWSNTIANMPAWGAINGKLGNNPLVIAVPFGDEAIVLDMAMSQYSYGALEVYEMKNAMLPFPGGFDSNGTLTSDPSAIRKSQRALPIGLWKGAGLSLLLDILASILSAGLSVSGITAQKSESRLSQVFIAIDIRKLSNYAGIQALIAGIMSDYQQSVPLEQAKKVRYPGEQVVIARTENAKLGIPVLRRVWDEIKALS
jgi:3-dehydro-L-gulonate 2-dehydrogenase